MDHVVEAHSGVVREEDNHMLMDHLSVWHLYLASFVVHH